MRCCQRSSCRLSGAGGQRLDLPLYRHPGGQVIHIQAFFCLLSREQKKARWFPPGLGSEVYWNVSLQRGPRNDMSAEKALATLLASYLKCIAHWLILPP